MGHNLGFHATIAHIIHLLLPFVVTHRITADFSTIYRGSVTTTVQPLLQYFLHDLTSSRSPKVAQGLRQYYVSIPHRIGDFLLLTEVSDPGTT